MSSNNSNFSILSLNVQSINAKFDELKITIEQINQVHSISVICICNVYFCSNLVVLSTAYLMLITSDKDNCSTQGMLRNRISCMRGIVMMKANIVITSPESAFHNFIVIHKV